LNGARVGSQVVETQFPVKVRTDNIVAVDNGDVITAGAGKYRLCTFTNAHHITSHQWAHITGVFP